MPMYRPPTNGKTLSELNYKATLAEAHETETLFRLKGDKPNAWRSRVGVGPHVDAAIRETHGSKFDAFYTPHGLPKVTVKSSKAIEKPKASKPKHGIGDLVKSLIAKDKDNDAILVAVKKAFPEARTNGACVNWYRNQLDK